MKIYFEKSEGQKQSRSEANEMDIEDSPTQYLNSINPEILVENVSISAMEISLNFIIYSVWEENKIYLYSIKTKANKEFMQVESEAFVNSMLILKSEGLKFLFISFSNGKLLFYKFNSNEFFYT